jgi:hypothetical protein
MDPEATGFEADLMHRALIKSMQEGDGPVVLMPKRVMGRVLEHHQSLLDIEKGFQTLTSGFKGVVLPTSTKWVFGNAFESGIRSMLSGLGYFDYRLGKKIAKAEPEAMESVIPGGHMTQVGRMRVFRDARQFEGKFLGPLSRALGAFRRTPGPKQLADLYVHYRNGVFAFNEKFIERVPQYAALGKEARRDLQAQTGRWHHALMVGEGAVQDLARGLRNTDKQNQYARAVEEIFGNWGKNSPAARRFLTNLAPFWMWARAATKFVTITLPVHHPIKTGLIAAAEDMTEQERKRLGLDFYAKKPLPRDAQGAIPGVISGGGGITPASYYSSFGIFADYPGFLSGVLFPQLSGLPNLAGIDWKGDKLVYSEDKPINDPAKLIGIAAASQAEARRPFAGLGSRIRTSGVSAVNPLRSYSPGLVRYLRELSQMQQINVPAKPSGGSDSAPWAGPSSSPGEAPWKSSTSSSGTAPWK